MIDVDLRDEDRVVERVAWVEAVCVVSPRAVFRVEIEYSSSSDVPSVAWVVEVVLWEVVAEARPREERAEVAGDETALF